MMRKDMDKVIVERPRFGSRLRSRKKGYSKYLQKVGIENLPRREPMIGRWHGMDRNLNEHLGPMRRFLRSRVGRLWNDVHRELCEHISFDNAVQKHVLAHVYQYVQRLVEIRDGNVIVIQGWWCGRVLRQGDMYICPRTGVLKIVRVHCQTHAPAKVGVGQLTQQHQRGGAWWELKLRKLPDSPGELWDVWVERAVASLTEVELIAEFGAKLIAVSKRLLATNEIRALHRRLRKARRGNSRKKPRR